MLSVLISFTLVTDDAGNRNNLLSVPISEKTTPEHKPDEETTPSAMEEPTSHHVAELQSIGGGSIDEEKQVEEAPIDTQAKEIDEVEPPKKQSELPVAKKQSPEPEKTALPEQEIIDKSHASVSPPEAVESTKKVEHPNASFKPALSEPVEPHSTPAQSTVMAETPTLIVEKVDSQLSYGDDFGEKATVGQKDTHLLRSQDAEPDHVIMRTGALTPELADVAAEVSESAAILDHDPPTPPISDEEAGRIGYRRMSHTPIPEVADTAAEVAEVAATLDDKETVSPTPLEITLC